MRESTKLPSSPANNLIRMSPDSGDLNQSSVTKTIKARRRRFKFRQLKYTCQMVSTNGSINGDQKQERKKRSESSNNGYQDSVKISVSLSTTENDVVLSRLEDGRIPELKRYGVVSVIGRRREMEDAVRAELGFLERGGQIYDFYGVYDGHGGAHVANTCRERFHDVVAKEVELTGEGQIGKEVEWERLMQGCFGKLDDEVKEIAAAKTVGATAVVAVVGDEVVVIANCGDCRAVISRAGIALPLSTDHKPERPDELMRIEAAGGKVINWNGYRVLGVLATSRSIGDKYLKPFVISTPEVTVRKRTDDDEFLILASDGLWDVIPNELACQVVKKCLKGQMRRSISKEIHESSTSMAAAVLAELAMARGSRDNISVIVVELSKHN